MQSPLQFMKKVDIKYYYLLLLLAPSLIYLCVLILAIKFTNSLGTLLVFNVLILVIFENLVPLIQTRLALESRIEADNVEFIKDWVQQTKQRVVLVLSAVIILMGMVIDLANTIEQWNWKYTSVVWLVYFTFAFPISALLPPREEHT